MRKLQNVLPKPSFLTIYKLFVRQHLDFGEIINDQAFNNSFQCQLERIKYNAALAMTGAIRNTSKGKLYQELSFETL